MTPVVSIRDLEREASFLSTAAGDHAAFVEHVAARLQLGEREYGDAWATRDLRELLGELLEEAADLGAWAVLAEQRLSTSSLTIGERDRVVAVLSLVARHGAQAHRLLIAAIRWGGA